MQDDTLSGDAPSVDKATKKNLDNLVKIGEELLKKPLARVDLDTGRIQQACNNETNEQALIRYINISRIRYLFCFVRVYLKFKKMVVCLAGLLICSPTRSGFGTLGLLMDLVLQKIKV